MRPMRTPCCAGGTRRSSAATSRRPAPGSPTSRRSCATASASTRAPASSRSTPSAPTPTRRPRRRRPRRAPRRGRRSRHRRLPRAERAPRHGRRRRRAARRLVRAGDLLGRTGADEIAVLMPGTGLGGAESCCERLIAALAGARLPHVGRVTVSAGVAAGGVRATVDALLADACAGVDLARAEGGGRTATRPTDGAGSPVPRHADVIEALSTALLERDRYTGEHSECVVELARDVARAIGVSEIEVERIAAAALVHDVGKVAIPDRILHKPAPLDDDEWLLMRDHPVIGERILRTVPGMGAVARIVRHEHERFDGRGYPDGLAGEEIPIGSRVILACDAYHAMTSDRPYRRAMAHDDAVAELVRAARTQFDPRVVAALLGRVANALVSAPPR